jgi:hypothetical protein
MDDCVAKAVVQIGDPDRDGIFEIDHPQPIAVKNTAKNASSTITRKIA